MDVYPEKVGEKKGKDRYTIINRKTRKPVIEGDVSEQRLRRFFKKRGATDTLITEAFRRARTRWQVKLAEKADEDNESDFFDDLVQDIPDEDLRQ